MFSGIDHIFFTKIFRYLKSFKKHRLNHALEKLHGKSSDIPKELKSSGDEDNNSKGIPENSNDQVSSSNETINVDEEENANLIVKKENNISEEVTGKSSFNRIVKWVFLKLLKFP